MRLADERQGFVTNPSDDERVRWCIAAAALSAHLDLADVEIDRDLECLDVAVHVGWFRALVGLGPKEDQTAEFRKNVRQNFEWCGLSEYIRWPLCTTYTR